MIYIIKISPELTIKSKQVRKKSILLLKKNIKKHFDFQNIQADISWNRDRIIIDSNNIKIKNILKNIPWIANYIEVDYFSFNKNSNTIEIFDFIFSKTKKCYLKNIENKNFAIRVKRSWTHDFSSIDLEKYLWKKFLENSSSSKVKLNYPDIVINIEIKDDKLYIVKKRYEWIWWYPIWFQDKLISLVSWWFDSWISSYLMMKRWCLVDFLFFNLWWRAHELWVKQASYYLWKTYSIPHKDAKFITINLENLIKELITKVDHKYRWVLLKRYMLKISSIISNNDYHAIIKWDSIWQVSSQTLINMNIIDKASSNMVLRPLIWSNKQEIIDISKKIWTYNFACNMPEYCWIISDKPCIWAKEEQILLEEEKVSKKIINECINSKKIEYVKNMLDLCSNKEINIELINNFSKNDIIIDLREKENIIKSPLKINWIEIIEIPFYDINHKFKFLNQKKNYLFYCEKWILSKLHWLYLKEKWFNNIKIFYK